jgi:hypothetical protein
MKRHEALYAISRGTPSTRMLPSVIAGPAGYKETSAVRRGKIIDSLSHIWLSFPRGLG